MKEQLEQSKGYVQLILGVGFLALFASWSFAEPFLSPKERAWSGLLGAFSVTAFILQEVINLFFISIAACFPALRASQSKIAKSTISLSTAIAKPTLAGYIWFWLFAWIVATSTGVASAGIVLWSFARSLSSDL